MGVVILCIILAVIAVVVVLYLCIFRPLSKNSDYYTKEENLYIGMPEEEMIEICGIPSKTVNINKNCKLVSYTLDEWKGILFGGSQHHELTVTIKNGKITDISSTE